MGRKKQSNLRDLVGTADKSNIENTEVYKGKIVDCGLDISSSVIGVCLVEKRNGKLVKKFAIKLNKTSLKDLYDKVDYALCVLQKELICSEFIVNKIYIEDHAKKFSNGFTTADTLFLLAKINGIISYELKRVMGLKPAMINVSSARKVLGIKINNKDKTKNTKQKVFEIVRGLNPDFSWDEHEAKTGKNKGNRVFCKHNEDVADAWIIARAGQILEP